MSVMVNIISGLLSHILTISQIDNPEYNSRNRQDRKKQDLPPGIQKDGGKQDSGNCPGSSYGNIVRVLMTPGQVVQGSKNHPSKV